MATNLPASVEHVHRQVFLRYVDEMMSYVNNIKVKDSQTNLERFPDETFMRDIEEWMSIAEQNADDFRRGVAAFIGNLVHQNKAVGWDSHPMLKRAIEDFVGVKAPPEIVRPNHKYRQVNDPWEPAW